MLDRAYNLYRLEHHGITLDDHPQYRSYQTFYELAVAPPPPKRWPTSLSKLGTEPRVQN